jgi:hypothetical protein
MGKGKSETSPITLMYTTTKQLLTANSTNNYFVNLFEDLRNINSSDTTDSSDSIGNRNIPKIVLMKKAS